MILPSTPISKQIFEKIEAIIFDFGGVLFNIDYDAPVKAFHELGSADFKAIYAQSSQTPLFDRLETGTISRTEFYEQLREILGISHDDQTLEHAWNTILLDIPKERIDLIYRLKSSFRTFLFSNTNEIHVGAFEKVVDVTMGLDYFKAAFEKVHYSNVLGIKKPYPESFISYCHQENLDPSKTLFIDDSYQHVEGAHQAGLFAYHLDIHKMDVIEIFSALLEQ